MNNVLINRDLLSVINNVFRYFSVLTLTGPRQSGKTTLCRKLFGELPYYNLEDAATLSVICYYLIQMVRFVLLKSNRARRSARIISMV